MDGVNTWPLYTVKCQSATRVTIMGDPFLYYKMNINRVHY